MKMSSPGRHADSDLVVSECGYEIDDGELVRVPAADRLHAERHAKLSALLEAHVAEDFKVAIDMLTRTSQIDDIAPDASVFPRARNPQTGRRRLEHLAFEIVSAQTRRTPFAKPPSSAPVEFVASSRSMSNASRRSNGRRRSELGACSIRRPSSRILRLPFRCRSRSCCGQRKQTTRWQRRCSLRAIPCLWRPSSNSRATGHAAGLAEAVVRVLARRNVPLTPANLERIRAECDISVLQRWLDRAITCTALDELFVNHSEGR